jgi:hypothetical protein
VIECVWPGSPQVYEIAVKTGLSSKDMVCNVHERGFFGFGSLGKILRRRMVFFRYSGWYIFSLLTVEDVVARAMDALIEAFIRPITTLALFPLMTFFGQIRPAESGCAVEGAWSEVQMLSQREKHTPFTEQRSQGIEAIFADLYSVPWL